MFDKDWTVVPFSCERFNVSTYKMEEVDEKKCKADANAFMDHIESYDWYCRKETSSVADVSTGSIHKTFWVGCHPIKDSRIAGGIGLAYAGVRVLIGILGSIADFAVSFQRHENDISNEIKGPHTVQ